MMQQLREVMRWQQWILFSRKLAIALLISGKSNPHVSFGQ